MFTLNARSFGSLDTKILERCEKKKKTRKIEREKGEKIKMDEVASFARDRHIGIIYREFFALS